MESKSSTERESSHDQQPSRNFTTQSLRRAESMKELIFFFEHFMTGERRLEINSDSDEEISVTHEERSDSQEISKGKPKRTEEQKCYDPLDATLTFVDGNDDLDFLCEDFKGPRAKMSCGHAVTPMSLTKWCRRLLDQGQCRFVCGVCDGEWPFEEVCKMALLTPEEINDFEKKMFSNAARDLGLKACPGCQSCVMRTDLHDLSVKCTVCTADKGRTYKFCWQCLREWKGPAPRSDQCENDGCDNLLGTLTTFPDITFKDVKWVTGCPSIRACPTCGFLVEHNKTQCKNITCPQCKNTFCFVCLKPKVCKSYFKACSSGVAPRQTSIPVWQRK